MSDHKRQLSDQLADAADTIFLPEEPVSWLELAVLRKKEGENWFQSAEYEAFKKAGTFSELTIASLAETLDAYNLKKLEVWHLALLVDTGIIDQDVLEQFKSLLVSDHLDDLSVLEVFGPLDRHVLKEMPLAACDFEELSAHLDVVLNTIYQSHKERDEACLVVSQGGVDPESKTIDVVLGKNLVSTYRAVDLCVGDDGAPLSGMYGKKAVEMIRSRDVHKILQGYRDTGWMSESQFDAIMEGTRVQDVGLLEGVVSSLKDLFSTGRNMPLEDEELDKILAGFHESRDAFKANTSVDTVLRTAERIDNLRAWYEEKHRREREAAGEGPPPDPLVHLSASERIAYHKRKKRKGLGGLVRSMFGERQP